MLRTSYLVSYPEKPSKKRSKRRDPLYFLKFLYILSLSTQTHSKKMESTFILDERSRNSFREPASSSSFFPKKNGREMKRVLTPCKFHDEEEGGGGGGGTRRNVTESRLSANERQ